MNTSVKLLIVTGLFFCLLYLAGCNTTYSITAGDSCTINLVADDASRADGGSTATSGKVDKQLQGAGGTINDQGDGAESGNPEAGGLL